MLDEDPIPAHGGELVDLLVPGPDGERLAGEAANHPKVEVSERELADLEMLSVGALSPLTGFQSEDEYRSIVDHGATKRMPARRGDGSTYPKACRTPTSPGSMITIKEPTPTTMPSPATANPMTRNRLTTGPGR